MSQLWVPVSQRQPTFVGTCFVCGSEFTAQHTYTLHVTKCADRHGAELAQLHSSLNKWNEPVDPEWQTYNQALKAAGYDPEVQYNRGRRSNVRRASES